MYIISEFDTDKTLKIGFSRNISGRMAMYRTAYKGDCRVWAIVAYKPSPTDTEFSNLGEKYIHKWLSKQPDIERVKSRSGNNRDTEWFIFPDHLALERAIIQMTEQAPFPEHVTIWFDPATGKTTKGRRYWTKPSPGIKRKSTWKLGPVQKELLRRAEVERAEAKKQKREARKQKKLTQPGFEPGLEAIAELIKK